MAGEAVLFVQSIDELGNLDFTYHFDYFNNDVKILDSLAKYEACQDKKYIYFSRNILLNVLRDGRSFTSKLPKFWQSEPDEYIFNCTDGFNPSEANIICDMVNNFKLDFTKVTLEVNVVQDFDNFRNHFSERGFTQLPSMFDSQWPITGITKSLIASSKFLHKSKWFVTCSRNSNRFRHFKFIDMMRRNIVAFCHFSYYNFEYLYGPASANKDLIPLEHYDKYVHQLPDNHICRPAKKYWLANREEIYSQMPYTLPGEPEELGAKIGEMALSDSFVNAHNDSHFCCLIETMQDGGAGAFLPTEKIGKTMFLRKPFLVYSTQYYLKYLREMGFKTFGDFWDESYDSEPDPYVRASMINDIMEDIRHSYATSQIEYMVLQMAEITDHNHNLMMNKLMKPHYDNTLVGNSGIKDIMKSQILTSHYMSTIERELRFMDTNKWRKPHPKL